MQIFIKVLSYFFKNNKSDEFNLLSLRNKLIKQYRMNIKEVIKNHGLTSKAVAERMGITPIGLSQHINGNPSAEVLERIAGAIGCNAAEFFQKPSSGNFTCPSCGASLKLTAEITAKEE